MKKKILETVCVTLIIFVFSMKITSAQASVVTDRLKAVEKVYPSGSTIDKMIEVNYMYKDDGFYQMQSVFNGGCNAFVSYATIKIFHNGYTPGTTSFNKVGKTVSTTNTTDMKNLFKKARPGDVVAFTTSNDDKHFAIFKYDSASGIYIDEANYGSLNKVYINHLWKWSNMKNWSMGATKVSVYRSYNYNKVNKNKVAKILKKGTKFTYSGITYKVTKSSIIKGKVKVVSVNEIEDINGGTVPKYVGVNEDSYQYMNSKLNKLKYGQYDPFLQTDVKGLRYSVYFNNKFWLNEYKEKSCNEQEFVVTNMKAMNKKLKKVNGL